MRGLLQPGARADGGRPHRRQADARDGVRCAACRRAEGADHMTRGAFLKQVLQIRVGLGSCGIASGAEAVRDAIERVAKEAGANGIVKTVGCNGMCHCEPLVEVLEPDGAVVLYGNVTAQTAEQIARRHIRPHRIATRVRWLTDSLKDSPATSRRSSPPDSPAPPAPPSEY